jgi:hypothetical protein
MSVLDVYAGNESNDVFNRVLMESRNYRPILVMYIPSCYMQVRKIPYNFNILTNLDQFQ